MKLHSDLKPQLPEIVENRDFSFAVLPNSSVLSSLDFSAAFGLIDSIFFLQAVLLCFCNAGFSWIATYLSGTSVLNLFYGCSSSALLLNDGVPHIFYPRPTFFSHTVCFLFLKMISFAIYLPNFPCLQVLSI